MNQCVTAADSLKPVGGLNGYVTRNDYPWGEALGDTVEDYALAVRISDRANETARLYTQLRARLRPRQAARVRARL